MNGWVTFCKVIRAANPNNGDVDISQRLLDLFVVEVGYDAISDPVLDFSNAGADSFCNEIIPLRLSRL